MAIPWTASASGLIADGGWTLSNNSTTLRFDVEDSATCGGTNGNVQTGNATATIILSHDAELTVYLRGMGESLTDNVERMTVSVDGMVVADAANVAATTVTACDAMPAVQSVRTSTVLTAHTPYSLEVFFTTTTAEFHQGVFFEARFKFLALY